ncbi:hypothetical protein ABZP36_003037, partial [Zizania latifolia]
DKKCFSKLIDEFNDKVFTGQSLPKHYVIRGIIVCTSVFIVIMYSYFVILNANLYSLVCMFVQFWMNTRYYDHHYYDIVRRPLEHVSA